MNRVILHYGEGRGKSSSGIGLVARALGHDKRVLVIQFFKPEADAGLKFLERATDNLRVINCGDWYFLNNPNHSYCEKFHASLAEAKALIRENGYNVILLDEVNFATYFDILGPREIIDFVNSFDDKIFILTGRYPAQEIIDFADTASLINSVKHGYDIGINAQAGVEF